MDQDRIERMFRASLEHTSHTPDQIITLLSELRMWRK